MTLRIQVHIIFRTKIHEFPVSVLSELHCEVVQELPAAINRQTCPDSGGKHADWNNYANIFISPFKIVVNVRISANFKLFRFERTIVKKKSPDFNLLWNGVWSCFLSENCVYQPFPVKKRLFAHASMETGNPCVEITSHHISIALIYSFLDLTRCIALLSLPFHLKENPINYFELPDIIISGNTN